MSAIRDMARFVAAAAAGPRRSAAAHDQDAAAGAAAPRRSAAGHDRDAAAGSVGLTVDMRAAGDAATFTLDAPAVRALADLLAAYRYPDDHGRCPSCGAPLDRDLHCTACGHVDGIFGQALAAHAESVHRRHTAEGGA
jgi:hypothetical protein